MSSREAASEEFPLQPELIKKYHDKDPELQKKTKSTKFSNHKMENVELIQPL